MTLNKDLIKTQVLLEKYLNKVSDVVDVLNDLQMEICYDISRLNKKESEILMKHKHTIDNSEIGTEKVIEVQDYYETNNCPHPIHQNDEWLNYVREVHEDWWILNQDNPKLMKIMMEKYDLSDEVEYYDFVKKETKNMRGKLFDWYSNHSFTFSVINQQFIDAENSEK